MDYLTDIIEHKKLEISTAKRDYPVEQLKDDIEKRRIKTRSLKESLISKTPAIIAEIKRKSPSKGELRAIKHPEIIAADYEFAGAAGISILTDSKYFGGSLRDLEVINERINIPLLRKDFIIDSYQVYESKAYGADAILLITNCLELAQLKELYNLAYNLELEVLLETETEEDIRKVNSMDIEIIGINNRNLHTFDESITRSSDLVHFLPEKSIKISESGITGAREIRDLHEKGFHGFLLGGTLMTSKNPGQKLEALINSFKQETA
ncbi:indole-3-glycerol phosphate synthase TrpC [candidate division KSB1 bacterium]